MNNRNIFVGLLAVCFLVLAPLALPAQQHTSSESDEQKPFLGIQVLPLNDRVRALNNITVEKGVVVKHVLPDTPAERAGLKTFDVIQAVDQTPVSSVSELRQQIRSRSSGDRIVLDVHRKGNTVQVRAGLRRDNNSEKHKEVSDTSDSAENKKMKELMEKMGEIERPDRSGSDENRRSARKPQELREKMKSFLEENGTQPTGESKDKSGEGSTSGEETDKFKRMYKKLKESLPDDVAERLSPEHLRTLTEKTRKWLRETSAENVKKTLTKLLDEMKTRIESLDGKNLQKAKEWKESMLNEMRKQMKTFEERMDKKLNRFENRLEEEMEQYNKQLQERIEQLKRLRDEREARRSSEDDNGSPETTSQKPYLGIRPSEAPSGSGVVIRQVQEDSPADRAGLQKGDVIRKMNGAQLKSVRALQEQFYQFSPGDKITLFVERDGWTKKITLKVGRRSGDSQEPSPKKGDQGGAGNSSLEQQKFIPSGFKQDGERAYWMLEMMTDYRHGRYIQLIKNGFKRGMLVLKEKLNKQPLQIDARIRLSDPDSGEVLFSFPIQGDLSELVNRLDRFMKPFLEQASLEQSGSGEANVPHASEKNWKKGGSVL